VTDQTNPTPEDVVHDADPDAVNVESVNDGEPAPAQGAGSPAGHAAEDAGAVDGEGVDAPSSEATDAPSVPSVSLDEHQRLMAEYVNYKRRVDRDRAEIQQRAIGDVLESLLPVLDEINLAREHGDLAEGPFRSIAEKLEGSLGRYGLERFGAVGEAFDPMLHEALMHAPWDASNEDLPKDATSTTVVGVMQPGYRAGERVIRAARVAVADPE
jgi:molecular chaperone GrpE